MADKKAVLNLNFDSEDIKINFQYICLKEGKTMTEVLNEFVREKVKRAGIEIPKINYNKRG